MGNQHPPLSYESCLPSPPWGQGPGHPSGLTAVLAKSSAYCYQSLRRASVTGSAQSSVRAQETQVLRPARPHVERRHRQAQRALCT